MVDQDAQASYTLVSRSKVLEKIAVDTALIEVLAVFASISCIVIRHCFDRYVHRCAAR